MTQPTPPPRAGNRTTVSPAPPAAGYPSAANRDGSTVSVGDPPIAAARRHVGPARPATDRRGVGSAAASDGGDAGFVHLHVASGYSLRYGVSTPAALVAKAVALGQPALALTDRDGLYGAVRFARACDDAGIGAVLGVDLALAPQGPASQDLVVQAAAPAASRRPVRGGQLVDPRRPRVTVLARGSQQGLPPGAGWGRLCRLVTATHLAGERGTPVTTVDLVAEHAACPHTGQGALVVLLGPDSDVGRAVLARRRPLAARLLRSWRERLPQGSLVVEAVCHDGPPGTLACRAQAQEMLQLAHAEGVPSVLTAMVRYADPDGAVTADVLDAARRLVALDTRHLDRVTTSGYLASSAEMADIARRVAGDDAPGLLTRTAALAAACVQHPRADLGIGSVQLPEPDALGLAPGRDPQVELADRCRAGITRCYPHATPARLAVVHDRLDDELHVIAQLGYASYFLTVATVCDLVRETGGRVAARGSGAGSLVNHLLGISGVDPIRHDLLMERFCTPLRAQLPDIDIDVESDRRTAIYERVLDHFGADRVTCVSMMGTYRVRHAIRDVGAALGMPPIEVDAIAKAFPHIRARDARAALAELPELRRSGLDAPRLATVFDLVERLDGLPRHIALHPCGVVLSNRALLDRTPVEASWLGFPMSHFDKDDVEALGLLKLDVLGIRMQSAMAHAVAEVERVDGVRIDLDDRAQVPLDDEATFRLIRTTRTLGCFQIESPGQRELIGKFGPQTFDDIVIDISLFRPGPVKSDMITPFLAARQGWAEPEYLHPSLEPALRETAGVVVFHEQVLRIVATTTGCTLAEADEVRRAMGTVDGQARVEAWWRPAAQARGYPADERDRIWEVLRAFASFGFCKAHAAAFALPTYQSAWLKTHHPAAFLAGVLTHDPGMYPKRLVLDDARSLGISVLGLDVNASDATYRVEKVLPADGHPTRRAAVAGATVVDGATGNPEEQGTAARAAGGGAGSPVCSAEPTAHPSATQPATSSLMGRSTELRTDLPADLPADLPDGRAYGIRLSLADVKGISEAEVERIVAGRPYASLADLWNRARPSRPVAERLVLAGALDSLYGLGDDTVGRRGRVTRRDLLLHLAELDRYSRALETGRLGWRTSRRAVLPPPARRAAALGERQHGAHPGPGLPPGHAGHRTAHQAGPEAPHDPPRGPQHDWPRGSRQGRTVSGTAREVDGVQLTPSARTGAEGGARADDTLRWAAARQSRAPQAAPSAAEQTVQLALDLGDAPELLVGSGLPELTAPERVQAELEVLGLDVSRHVLTAYTPLLDALGVVRSRDLLSARNRREILVAGVKVATQTPPVRSGRRVVFVTLDDATGPVDATFFEDVQGPYAGTVFHSWLLVVRGVVRRTGPRGISLRATGAWELGALWDRWRAEGTDAVLHHLDADRPTGRSGDRDTVDAAVDAVDIGMTGRARRVLVHASGFTQSPYAHIAPAGMPSRDTRGLVAALDADPDVPAPTRPSWGTNPSSAGKGAGKGAPIGIGPGGRHVVPACGDPTAAASLVPDSPGAEGPGSGPTRPTHPARPDPYEQDTAVRAPRRLWYASPGSSGH